LFKLNINKISLTGGLSAVFDFKPADWHYSGIACHTLSDGRYTFQENPNRIESRRSIDQQTDMKTISQAEPVSYKAVFNRYKLAFPSLFILLSLGCGSDDLSDVEVTEQAYFSAMSRMHEEIGPRYFAHISGESVDESVLSVTLTDISNCDPDGNGVVDTYLRCVLSYFIERDGSALTVSLDSYQSNRWRTNFKINQDAPFTRLSFSIVEDEFTAGKRTTFAKLEVDGDLQEVSNPFCVYSNGVLNQFESSISIAECDLLGLEMRLFFDSL
jgi:hypothetical protein